ncbi:YunG family protein [Streptomyces formicae]
MTPLLLSDIESAVRDSWGADTCPPDSTDPWPPENPARDQCGVTALVLHDLLGGELVRGEVHVDGIRTDYHWWNRLGAGVDVDLTREQFAPQEIVTAGTVIARPPEIRRCRAEYELLRARVLARLGELAGERSARSAARTRSGTAQATS